MAIVMTPSMMKSLSHRKCKSIPREAAPIANSPSPGFVSSNTIHLRQQRRQEAIERARTYPSAEEDGVPLEELIFLVVRSNEVRRSWNVRGLCAAFKKAANQQTSIAPGYPVTDDANPFRRKSISKLIRS